MTSFSSHDQLLLELSRVVNRDHLVRRRRRRVALGAAAAMLVCAATVAAATQAPWWQTAAPPVNPRVVDQQLAPTKGDDFPPAADRSRARTVAAWNGATLVAAPVGRKGGYCLIPALPGSPDIGLSCEYQATDDVRAYARPGSDPRWVIWGRLVEPDAATIDMTDAVGAALEVTLQPGGFFIADLPRSRWSALNQGAGSAELLDSSGKAIANVCLNFGPSPDSSAAGQSDTPSPLNAGACKAQQIIPMAPVLAKATKLVATTLRYDDGQWRAGSRIAVYQTPDAGSSATCIITGPDPLPGTGTAAGGGECGDMSEQTSPAHPLNASADSGLSNDSYAHLVTGRVDPSLHAARVEVELPDATVPLALANNTFIGDLAPTSSTHIADAYVVAFDASGNQLAREKLWAP